MEALRRANRGYAAAAAVPALGLGRRLPPEAPRLGGADAAPAAAAAAALDFLLRALQCGPQRPVRPVALQLAGAGRQLPRPAHRLLPLHQVPLLQGALAGPGPAGPLLHRAQGHQPGYSNFIIWTWLLVICQSHRDCSYQLRTNNNLFSK
uniref:Uncharacterized protein n=1 Tax=Mus musculus TaxID=10090 RepID=Q9D7P2_MOUSE|nr:unnamed protein product [Mus musculus]